MSIQCLIPFTTPQEMKRCIPVCSKTQTTEVLANILQIIFIWQRWQTTTIFNDKVKMSIFGSSIRNILGLTLDWKLKWTKNAGDGACGVRMRFQPQYINSSNWLVLKIKSVNSVFIWDMQTRTLCIYDLFSLNSSTKSSRSTRRRKPMLAFSPRSIFPSIEAQLHSVGKLDKTPRAGILFHRNFFHCDRKRLSSSQRK